MRFPVFVASITTGKIRAAVFRNLALSRRKADISCVRDQFSREVQSRLLFGRALTQVVKTQIVKDAKVDLKARQTENKAAPGEASLEYQSGFGNHFVSEAVAGALPVGRNSPQRPPLGLYAEQISGTSFTTARAENRHTWTYRIQPSVVHQPYARTDNGLIRSAPFNEADATPTQLRWSPFQIPREADRFR